MNDLWDQLLRYVNGDASAKLPKDVFADLIREQTVDYREAVEEITSLRAELAAKDERIKQLEQALRNLPSKVGVYMAYDDFTYVTEKFYPARSVDQFIEEVLR